MASRFTVKRNPFAPRPEAEDNGDGLPSPATIKLNARRVAGIKEAKSVLEHLPQPGESLHALCTARMDLTDVISRLIEARGPITEMRVATLGYNARNLKTILQWLDTGNLKSLQLLASIFFRAHNGGLWEETLSEFQPRGQKAACGHSHAKVVSLAFANGERMSIEGSANLCGNGSGREQFALINDASLHDWHAAWIGEMVRKNAP